MVKVVNVGCNQVSGSITDFAHFASRCFWMMSGLEVQHFGRGV